jgi:mannose/cellobiose epimerase-like protein (N-acyl-D-glucosamine 2-epimerase family)
MSLARDSRVRPAKPALTDSERRALAVLSGSGQLKEHAVGAGYSASIFADCFVVLGLSEVVRLTLDETMFARSLPGHTIESMWFVIDTAQATGRHDLVARAS